VATNVSRLSVMGEIMLAPSSTRADAGVGLHGCFNHGRANSAQTLFRAEVSRCH